jgi:NAD(P)-dependent dehydrogenase (short-subunit alcohol dehydrogenase family)
MKNFSGKKVLVTGAGSGIGRETAQAFARAGSHLLLTDVHEAGVRETRKLIEASGGSAAHFVVDVTDADAMKALAARVENEHGAVDVLVNNAGIAAAGGFLDTTLDTWRKVLDVNVMGVVHGCHAFLPAMVARGHGGHVVNLSSLLGFAAHGYQPVYCASKYAVLGFSESLRADMAKHNIGVTAICPGVIHTNIISATIMEGRLGQSGMRDKVDNFYTRRNFKPAQVAAAIIDAVKKNQAVRPVSPESWAMYYAARFTPGVVRMMARTEPPFLK